VRRGDTLWSIARRYAVSTRDLMRWNSLNSTTIHPGDRLTVRR
jgi:membrane-bound lytic murein transglycosylase D